MNLLEQQNAILYYQSQENVNADNLNYFYNATFQNLTSYFQNYSLYNNTNANQVGSICNGIGVLQANSILSNNFGQTGTSNIFTFKEGMIRFIDQLVTYPATGSGTVSTLQDIYAFWNGNIVGSSRVYTLEITTPTTDGTTYYVVAVLTLTANTAYQLPTVQINTVAISLADLQADQNSESPIYVALFNISTSDGTNYTVGIDEYCANNYNIYTYNYISNQIQSIMPYGICENATNIGNISDYLDTIESGTTYDFTGVAWYKSYSSGIFKLWITLTILDLEGNGTAAISLNQLLTDKGLPITANKQPLPLTTSIGALGNTYPVLLMSNEKSDTPTSSAQYASINYTDSSLPTFTITNSSFPYMIIRLTDTSVDEPQTITIEFELTNSA